MDKVCLLREMESRRKLCGGIAWRTPGSQTVARDANRRPNVVGLKVQHTK